MSKYSSQQEKWRLQKRAQRERLREQSGGQQSSDQDEGDGGEVDFWSN